MFPSAKDSNVKKVLETHRQLEFTELYIHSPRTGRGAGPAREQIKIKE